MIFFLFEEQNEQDKAVILNTSRKDGIGFFFLHYFLMVVNRLTDPVLQSQPNAGFLERGDLCQGDLCRKCSAMTCMKSGKVLVFQVRKGPIEL